ncbi:MAG: Crp/Fnr family transcriptional regulator [Bacilli bacterium]
MNILNLLNQKEKEKISYLNLKQNQILFHEGEECKSIFIIIEGQITILNYSLNGNEEIISILNKNDVFANALIFSNNNYYLGEIIATKPTKLAIINKNELISLLQNNKSFLECYINLIAEKTIKFTIKTKLLSHKNIRSRIIYYLEINNYSIKKNISFLAKELVLPRPSVSREISKMINEDIIYIKNNKIIYKKT